MSSATRTSVLRLLARLAVIAGWIGLDALWILWRASREGDYWPLYHWWFLAVTGVLVAVGIGLATLKQIAGTGRWERYWVTVVVGITCLVCFAFEIMDMVWNCQLARRYLLP